MRNEGAYWTEVVSYGPVLLLASNEYMIEGGTGRNLDGMHSSYRYKTKIELSYLCTRFRFQFLLLLLLQTVVAVLPQFLNRYTHVLQISQCVSHRLQEFNLVFLALLLRPFIVAGLFTLSFLITYWFLRLWLLWRLAWP